MTVLDPQRVLDLAESCNGVYVPPEDPRSVRVEGVTRAFTFDRWALDRHAAEIRAMLAELPEQFREGWSFLNGCTDRHGNLWTGMHSTVETLFALGMGVGAVVCCFQRDLWSSLPGGMPYYLVKMEAGS